MSAPLCRFCGKPIAKRTRRVWLHTRPLTDYELRTQQFARHLVVDELPRTKADCQKLTNWTVVSVSYCYLRPDEGAMRIDQFGEWDGESYVDPFFCTGEHARLFGYAAAQSGQVMAAYNKAKEAAQ